MTTAEAERLRQTETAGFRKIHVFVALCDNAHQGILPVPAAIGNGQDPKKNLYWGAGYGVKTQFSKSRDWKLVQVVPSPRAPILERLIFRHTRRQAYLVADAYDGAFIKEAIAETIQASSGGRVEPMTIDGKSWLFGGGADLLAYVGHDGLMEFTLDDAIAPQDARRRAVISLCCISRDYFVPLLKRAGATPLLMTTQLMCPEAYTLEAAVAGWLAQESPAQIRERAAQAYSKYQRISLKAARGVFTTGE